MKKSLLVSVLALAVSVVALAMQVCPKFAAVMETPLMRQNKNEAFVAELKKVLDNEPEIVIQTMQRYQEKQQEAAMAAAKLLIKDNIENINNSANSPFVGPKDAKIVVVEFFDYACGFCHRLAPELNEVMAKNADVKFVFKPLAFLSQGSELAAKAVLAANIQGKFIEMHNALFGLQAPLNEENIEKAAQKAGLDVKKLKADMEGEVVKAAMEEHDMLARKIQVNGVPTLVLNGEILQTIDGNVIQSSIDELK